MTRSMAIEYQYQLDLVDSILDSVELIHEHRSAVAQHERTEFRPDREAFNQLQDAGALSSFSVRYHGEIVGYCMVHVSHSLHQPDSIRGIVDNIYVMRAHRGRCGSKLIAFVSEQLLSFGVTDLYHLVPIAHEWGAVLKRQGFSHVENVYHKGL